MADLKFMPLSPKDTVKLMNQMREGLRIYKEIYHHAASGKEIPKYLKDGACKAGQACKRFDDMFLPVLMEVEMEEAKEKARMAQ